VLKLASEINAEIIIIIIIIINIERSGDQWWSISSHAKIKTLKLIVHSAFKNI
jgi:hypothetical protein